MKLTSGERATRDRKVIISYCNFGGSPRSSIVNGDARDKVIGPVSGGTNRDADDRGSTHAIRRGAHHKIVRCATASEAAVWPDHIDFARSINFSRRQSMDAEVVSGVAGVVEADG